MLKGQSFDFVDLSTPGRLRRNLYRLWPVHLLQSSILRGTLRRPSEVRNVSNPEFAQRASRQGKFKSWQDPRSRVFKCIMRWIEHLASRPRCVGSPVFSWFALENVMGMLSKRHDSKRSPAETVVRWFRKRLEGWFIKVVVVDAACTAQSRKRVYIVGIRSSQRSPDIQIPRLPDVELAEVILPGATLSQHERHDLSSACSFSPSPLSCVSVILKSRRDVALSSSHSCITGVAADAELGKGESRNLKKYLAKLKPQLLDKKLRGKFAAFHVDRNPDLSFCSMVRLDGRSPCIRANGGRICVVSLGGQVLEVARKTHAVEA